MAENATRLAHMELPKPLPSTASKASKQRRFLEVFEVTGHRGDAARSAGIELNTVYSWRKREPEFVTAMAEAEDRFLDSLEDVVRRAGQIDPRMARETLAARRPDGWSQKYNLKARVEDLRRPIEVILIPPPPEGTHGDDDRQGQLGSPPALGS